MSNEMGIVYVATKDERYVAEAFLSANSAKNLMPDMPITLFTNLEDSAFAKDDCFDSVICIDTIKKYRSAWSEGQLDRILCLPNSPYRYTLHLDTDTRVMSHEIREIFTELDSHDIAMVECAADASVSRKRYGRPMFNVGFILYKNTEQVHRLFTAWAELTAEYFGYANRDAVPEVTCLSHIQDPEMRRKLLFMDQISMVQLLSPEVNQFDLGLKILHESWNFRGARNGRTVDQNIRVDHQPSLRNRIGNDMLNTLQGYVRSGNPRRALGICNALLARAPDDTQLMKLVVNCHLQTRDLAPAERMLARILEVTPDDAEARSTIVAVRAGKI